MGDTGSLALGGALAGLAILTRTELLLVILGGLFVVDHAVGDRSRSAPSSSPGQTGVPDGAAAAPLRAARLGARSPIVIRFWIIAGPVRGRRARHLLRRVGRPDDVTRPSAEPRPATTDWAGVRAVVAGLRRLRLRRRRHPARTSAPRVIALDDATARRPASEQAELLEVLGADVRLGAGATADAARRRRPASSPRPGWRPTTPLLAAGRARAASRSGARSSWPGGCATRDGAAPWLAVTGTNGKTTTVQMLDVDPARRRPAQRRGRQRRPAARRGGAWTPSRTTCSRSSCPASSCTGTRLDARRVRRGASTSPTDHLDWHGSTATALRRRQGPDLRAARSVACVYNVGRPRDRAAGRGGRRRRGLPGDRLHPRHARPSACSASSTTSSSTGPSSSERADQRRRARARSPTSRRAGAAHTSPTRWPPPRWPGPTASRRPRSATACARSAPDGAPDRRRRRPSTASPTSTTPRPPTRTPRRPSLLAYDPVVWVAGGLAKGADVRRPGRAAARPAAGRRAARRATARVIAEALARHAPDVPVVDVDRETDTGWPWTASWPRPRPARPAGRHGAAGPGVRLDGHVRQLRRPRRRLRRGGATAARRSATAEGSSAP